MVALNFMEQFAASVQDGSKRQTIRARGKRPPPKVGQALQLFTGMRGNGCRKLRDATCTSVEPITISSRQRTVSVVRGLSGESGYWDALSVEEVEALARTDGFASVDDFFAFFSQKHGGAMSGFLIRWEVA